MLQARIYFMLIIASMYVDYLQPAFSPRACLNGGGGPQIGEVTGGGSPHLTCKCVGYITYLGSPSSM